MVNGVVACLNVDSKTVRPPKAMVDNISIQTKLYSMFVENKLYPMLDDIAVCEYSYISPDLIPIQI